MIGFFTVPVEVAEALERECPACYAPEKKVCNREVIGEFVAFPVKLPPPWSWFSGPRWVHIHRARTI